MLLKSKGRVGGRRKGIAAAVMRSNSKIKYSLKCSLLIVAILLGGCIDSSDDEADVLTLPLLGFDYPSAFSSVLSTDGGNVVLSGITLATASDAVASQLSFALQSESDTDAVAIETLPNPTNPPSPIFNWQFDLSTASPLVELQQGLNIFSVEASATDGSIELGLSITRGTSYMRETAIQYDSDGSQWYVLDAARRALLALNVPPPAGTGAIEKAVFSQNGDGKGQDLRRPVDFVIDAVSGARRALIVDAELKSIVSVLLEESTMGAGDEATRAMLNDGGLLEWPVAIAIDPDPTADRAFILDKHKKAIFELQLSTDTVLPTIFSDGTNAMEGVLIENPVDLVYQADDTNGDRLFLSDRRVIVDGDNARIKDEIIIVNSAGARSILADPDETDGDDNTVPDFDFLFIGDMAIENDILYVIDYNLEGIATINVAGGVSESKREAFSINLPLCPDGRESCLAEEFMFFPGLTGGGTTNTFALPESLAFGDGRLLVLDNSRGSIVEVETSDPDTLQQREYLAGGAVQSGSQDGNTLPIFSEFVAFPALPGARDLLLSSGGTIATTISGERNNLISIDLVRGSISQAGQIATVDENGDEDTGATEKTVFRNPRFLAAASSADYVIDRGTDRIIEILSDRSRAVASESAASTVEITNPVAMMLYERDADPDNGLPLARSELYILEADRIVKVDVFDSEANPRDPSDNREVLTTAGCTISSATAMTLFDKDDIPYLLIAEADGSLQRLNISDSAPMSPCAETAVVAATANIVDIVPDTRSDEADTAAFFLLDKANKQILSTTLSAISTSPLASAAALVSGPDDGMMPVQPGESNSNSFVSPDSFVFDQATERIFVLDNVINSLYVVDVKPRNATTGARDESGVVSGQRFVIYRGTAMNCDITDSNPTVVSACRVALGLD